MNLWQRMNLMQKGERNGLSNFKGNLGAIYLPLMKRWGQEESLGRSVKAN